MAELTAWTPHADLTPDQNARFGGYVLAKEIVGAEQDAKRAEEARVRAALTATGGDKMAAFALLLK